MWLIQYGKGSQMVDIIIEISDHQQSWAMRMDLEGVGATSDGGR